MQFRFIVVFLSALMITRSALASFPAADGSGTLQSELRRHYKLAVVKADGRGSLVVEGGQPLVIRQQGIVGFGQDESSFADLCPSEFVDGKMRAPSSACITLTQGSRKSFRLAQPVCITSIDVAEPRDSVAVSIVACDSRNRVRLNEVYRARLIFVFAKGLMSSLSSSRVEEQIGLVLASPGEASPADKPADPSAAAGKKAPCPPGNPSAESSQNKSSANPPEAATPAPPADSGASPTWAPIPPPPDLSKAADAPCPAGSADAGKAPEADPAPSGNGGTQPGASPAPSASAAQPASGEGSTGNPALESKITLGLTVDQVKAILGSPTSVAIDNGKKIYIYPTLKIVFINGTVSAIEKINP